MSDSQRIRGLGGIKPSRMPDAARPEIPVTEAEQRLGIGTQRALSAEPQANPQIGLAPNPVAVLHPDLPESLLQRKPKLITVSRTFRLPLDLVEELESVAALHEIPMVAIVAEAVKLHLTRFPKHKT